MGVVYLGTSAFAAGVLTGLAGGRWQPELVVTRPDARQGRGRSLSPPPVATTARELSIDLIQPDNVNDPAVAGRVADVAGGSAGAVILCAFGALITDPLLSAQEIYNVHPSLLPRWRGAAPVERAIIEGDGLTGVSIMRLAEELDAGPVYAQRSESIMPGDDYGSLSQRLQQLSIELLIVVLNDRPDAAAQSAGGVTYAEKLTASDRTLDLGQPAERLVRIVRALRPHVGARIALAGDAYLGVIDASVGESGELQLARVQPAGGKPMAYEEYLRGHGPLKPAG